MLPRCVKRPYVTPDLTAATLAVMDRQRICAAHAGGTRHPLCPVVVHRCARIPQVGGDRAAELEGAFTEGIGFDGSSIEGFRPVSSPTRSPGPIRRPSRSCRGPPARVSTTRRGCSATSPCPTAHRPGRTPGTCCAASSPRPATSASPSTSIPRSSSSCWPRPQRRPDPGAGGQRRLLRPGRARFGAQLPPARHRRAGADGHLGGVQPPRGARPASRRSTCATPTRCRWPTT